MLFRSSSGAGQTTYGIQFGQNPNGPLLTEYEFGVELSNVMYLTCDDVTNLKHQHRFILIAKHKATGKILGLDVTPLRSVTIRAFPLLITVRNVDRNQISAFMANSLVRGSVGADPTSKKSNYPYYLVTKGWMGGCITRSYASACCLTADFHRLTGVSSSKIKGVVEADLDKAINCYKAALDMEVKPLVPPEVRPYILQQIKKLYKDYDTDADMSISVSELQDMVVGVPGLFGFQGTVRSL